MEEIIKIIGVAILVVVVAFCSSVFGGSILWLIYPHIHALFPSALEKGILAENLEWWDAVCVTWIFYILIKSSNTNNSSK